MSLTKTWLVGLLFVGMALWAAVQSVLAESWKPASNKDGPAVATVDWQQQVLKRPVAPQEPAASQPSIRRESDRPSRSALRWINDRGSFGQASTAQEPGYPNRPRARLVSNEEAEVIPPGEIQYDPIAEQGEFAAEGCGEGGNCGSFGCDACDGCCDFGYECFDGRCGWWIRNLTVFAGGHGFKGPVDMGVNGNFGFQEGLGISGPLGDPWGCGYQMGANFVQSNFSGVPISAPSTDRTQYFVTAGIFRRELCRGFQWGVVWDYMHDRYFDTFNLHQLRGDIGFVIDGCNEIGFLGAFGVRTDTYDLGNFRDIQLDPTDMYAIYFRHTFENGGEGRFWGGATGRGDGLIGGDLWTPLGRGFALQNIINYKIPKEGRAGGAAAVDESWGLTINLVWYPGRSALCQRCNPYRPLLNVADNSLFMVDQIFP